MKVYLEAYVKNNLGDDLFIDILLDRYDEEFCLYSNNEYGSIFNKKMKVYDFKKYRLINKLIRAITLKRCNLKKLLSKKADVSVLISGSYFMEKVGQKNVFNLTSPYYIIGSNFGPYYTDEYYNKYYNIFKKAEDVCFRENYSKELFKDLDNVRVAPDIVFSLNMKDINIKENKVAVISVVDCNRKISNEYTDKYENNIIKLINLLSDKGYEIVLMSFCKAEGDEEAINRIYCKLPDNLKEKVEKYFYNGNIKEALQVIAESSIVFGTRYHANILGLILNKTVIPISYSSKIINVFNDMKFDGKIFDITDTQKFDLTDISDEDLKHKFNVESQIKDSDRQFEELDKILKRKENNE